MFQSNLPKIKLKKNMKKVILVKVFNKQIKRKIMKQIKLIK